MVNMLYRLILFTVNAVIGIIGLSLVILGGLMTWSKSTATKAFGDIWTTYINKMNLTNTSIDRSIGDAVLKMSSHYSQPIFAIGIIILLICIAGILGSCCKSYLCLKIYIVGISIVILSHLIVLAIYFARKQAPQAFFIKLLNYSINQYESISSGDTNSVFMGLVMIKFNCCGAQNGSDFNHSMKFAKSDVWNNKTFTTLSYPIPCCKFNKNLEIQDKSCPNKFTDTNSNINTGCLKPLHHFLFHYTDIAAYISIVLLLCEVCSVFCTLQLDIID
ncbi:tetraspanin-CD63 receptor [Schistosoma japonicum]|nr:tetraspanin-CD63 receptor [Schistosoma japonicum]